MLHISVSFTIVNTTPLLKDLHQCFTPQYSMYWRVIGAQLGLSSVMLDIIEVDHSRVVQCCNAMLKKWRQIDPMASWNKLFAAIHDIGS